MLSWGGVHPDWRDYVSLTEILNFVGPGWRSGFDYVALDFYFLFELSVLIFFQLKFRGEIKFHDEKVESFSLFFLFKLGSMKNSCSFVVAKEVVSVFPFAEQFDGVGAEPIGVKAFFRSFVVLEGVGLYNADRSSVVVEAVVPSER